MNFDESQIRFRASHRVQTVLPGFNEMWTNLNRALKNLMVLVKFWEINLKNAYT